MSPDSFNRLKNTSKEDFDRFVDWLFSHTLAELRSARGSMDETKAAWVRYFRRGLKAELLLDELMHYLPELFTRAQYGSEEASKVLEMIKQMNFRDVGINRTKEGVRFQ
jgi:hypothetical protein